MHVVVPSAAGTVQVKLGVPSNPFNRVNISVPLPHVPLFTLICAGVKASEKSTDVDAFAALAGATEAQFATRRKASIDPNPVAKSYPGVAV